MDAEPEPLNTWTGREAFHAVDHHWGAPRFATASSSVEVWDWARSTPVQSFTWGHDSVTAVRFNPAERDLLASAGADRSIGLYDLRAATPIRKLVMDMRTNALRWNPREPFNFTTASEDHQCYTFDYRKLDRALMVHKGHVSAVMDISYSPTGREFVTGSYDRTVRIFGVRDGKSREVYHTRRMQRIFCVQFSADARFVLSGSDDTNIRVWRARASEKLGRLAPRERAAKDYRDSLKRRYGHLPEVRRVAAQRHVPAGILKAAKRKLEADAKEKVKDARIRAHTAEATHKPRVPERKKRIVKELD
uniref:Sof1-like protein domain-containing protein n=1 Tax=Bicosoecida sp. CB-2014 TaxID=1486930 RepID=A0A7S1CS50_9STRA